MDAPNGSAAGWWASRRSARAAWSTWAPWSAGVAVACANGGIRQIQRNRERCRVSPTLCWDRVEQQMVATAAINVILTVAHVALAFAGVWLLCVYLVGQRLV